MMDCKEIAIITRVYIEEQSTGIGSLNLEPAKGNTVYKDDNAIKSKLEDFCEISYYVIRWKM